MENKSELNVFWGSGSPVSWRVLVALALKEIPYTSRQLEISQKDHKSEWFLALNPRGTFPVIQHGDVVVRDSLAILHYLEDAFPKSNRLLPDTPAKAAMVWQCIGDHEGFLGPHAQTLARGIFRKPPVKDRDAFEGALEKAVEEIQRLDAHLSEHAWVAETAKVSLADVVYYPTLMRLQRVSTRPKAAEWDMPFSSFDTFKGISAWLKRLEAYPGVVEAYPPHWGPHPFNVAPQ